MLAVTSVLAFAQASYQASAWTIQDDVDLATNYKFYTDAKVKDFLVSTGLNNSYINVDFAKQFKSVYLGLSYDGNLWGNNQSTETKSELSKTTNTNSNFYNYLNAFWGFDNNMTVGVSFSIDSKLSSSKTENKNGDTTKEHNNYTQLNIAAQWTGDFETSKFLLKPYFEANYQTYIDDNEPKRPYEKNNYILLNLGTDFIKGSRDAFYSDIDVNYSIFINNNKNYTKDDKDNGSMSKIDNALKFVYNTTYKFNDKLTFGGQVGVTMNFNFNKRFLSNGNLATSTFIYNLDSSISAGAKYAFVPEKFSLSTGLSMNLPNVAVIRTNYEQAKTVTTETVFNKNGSENRSFAIGLNVGFDWNITDNLVLDMGTYVPLRTGNNLFNGMSVGISYRK